LRAAKGGAAAIAPAVGATGVDRPMSVLAPMQVFRNIPVVPVTKVKRLKGQGGPIWPDFDTQVAARHCRGGVASDVLPARPKRLSPLAEPAVWAGFLPPHFGHLVSEYLTRLPQSLRDRPDDLYLFTAVPGMRAETLPGYVWDVIDGHGLRRDRVRVVEHPLLVQELRVAAQGETLGGGRPTDEFLDILATIAHRNGLVPEMNRYAFVTRAGLVQQGKGGHAGESYLAGLLQRLGVRVIEPGGLSIRRQMEVYAGAEALIFAEGSALHGRCLLGYVDQHIHVLPRRPFRKTARIQLGARCRQLSYHPVLAGRLGTRTDTRGNRNDLDVGLYDPEVLFAVFLGIGIDLKPHWDPAAYHAAVRSDLAAWMAKVPASADQMAENMDVLADLDLLPDEAASLPAPN
jgi:hypothetical protein